MQQLRTPVKCTVLGAGGFIGTNLLLNLRDNSNFKATAFSRNANQETALKDIPWIEGDFENSSDLERAIEGQELIFHLISATNPSTGNDRIIQDLNGTVAATIQLLDLCKKHQVKRIIFVSSGGTVYGIPSSLPIQESAETNPINSYGISKLLIEKYLHLYEHLYGIQSRILRVSNPYGPFQSNKRNQGVIKAFLSNAISQKPLEIWGSGNTVRDYIYIEDVINALVTSVFHSGNDRIFNIGSGQGVSLNELISHIKTIHQTEIQVTQKIGRPVDVPANILNIERALNQLKWKPNIEFADGIRKTYSWLLNNLNCM